MAVKHNIGTVAKGSSTWLGIAARIVEPAGAGHDPCRVSHSMESHELRSEYEPSLPKSDLSMRPLMGAGWWRA